MATVKQSSWREEMKNLFGNVPTWAGEIPESAVDGYWAMMRDFQLAETAIPNKYKELIGLGVSGATRCRYCALFHTEAAKLFGATDEEIAEAGWMAALTMAGSTFLNAQQVDHDTFRRETLDAVAYARAHAPATASTPGHATSAHA